MTLTARIHKTKGGADHLRVRQEVFSTAARDRLRRLGSPARWIASTNEWSTTLTPAAVLDLERAAVILGEQIAWADPALADFAKRHLDQHAKDQEIRLSLERMRAAGGHGFAPYPTDQAEPPMVHQRFSWHWSMRVRGILLGHDMGTGKTRSALDAIAGWYAHGLVRVPSGDAGGVLVICPPNVVATWQQQAARWQPGLAVVAIRGSRPAKVAAVATIAHAHVVNYENLRYALGRQWDGLIVDESHRISNDTSQTNRALGISQAARRIICLSGTQIANGLESLFFPMLVVDGGLSLGPSIQDYRRRFLRGQDHEDATRAVAEAISTYAHFLRKEEVLDLPPKTFVPIYLRMADDQARYYRQVRDDFKAWIQDLNVSMIERQARAMKLWEICQGFIITDAGIRHFSDVKAAAALDLLLNELRGRKVVIWAMFTFEIDRLCQILAHNGIGHVRLDSMVPQGRRQADVDRWNADPSIPVFVRQIAISEGQTLLAKESGTPCTNAIYLGTSWSWVHWRQSQDRNHRIGQTLPCTYHVLLTDEGLDRAIYERVLEKGETSQSVEAYTRNQWLALLADAA